MKEIFDLPGMDKWVRVDQRSIDITKEEGDSSGSPPIYLSLVCFVGLSTILSNIPIYQKVKSPHERAHQMFYSTFAKEEDHDGIDVAMANNPTIAIFMCHGNDEQKKKKKSILMGGMWT